MTSNLTSLVRANIALGSLTGVVAVAVFFTRLPAMLKHRDQLSSPDAPKDRASVAASGVFSPLANSVGDNFLNLFETPVLFYAASALTIALGKPIPNSTVNLAWTFVALRVVHSAIHCGRGPIPLRFAAFMFANACIAGMFRNLNRLLD
jgi:hypothetical protein